MGCNPLQRIDSRLANDEGKLGPRGAHLGHGEWDMRGRRTRLISWTCAFSAGLGTTLDRRRQAKRNSRTLSKAALTRRNDKGTR